MVIIRFHLICVWIFRFNNDYVCFFLGSYVIGYLTLSWFIFLDESLNMHVLDQRHRFGVIFICVWANVNPIQGAPIIPNHYKQKLESI
jgi:hypothetical protein